MRDYSEIFEGVLPADLVLEWGDPRNAGPTLFPEEAKGMAHAVEKRRLEFTKGRQCARMAMRRLGVPDQPLLVGSHREPIWPAGIMGSISHTDGLCAAAVGWQASYDGIGIDLEQAQPLELGVAERIATVREMGALPALPPLVVARAVFSAKESFYKWQFYQTREWLGFFDVEIELQASGGFSARLLVEVKQLARGLSVQGAWRQHDGFLFTAIWTPRSRTTAR